MGRRLVFCCVLLRRNLFLVGRFTGDGLGFWQVGLSRDYRGFRILAILHLSVFLFAGRGCGRSTIDGYKECPDDYLDLDKGTYEVDGGGLNSGAVALRFEPGVEVVISTSLGISRGIPDWDHISLRVEL